MRKVLAVGLVIMFLSLHPVVTAYKESDQLDGGQSTHQFIMDSFPTILRNDGYPHLADFAMTYLDQMKYGSMRADETIWDSREHYMDPTTHQGFLGFKSAGQLADERFDEAVIHWFAGERLSAFYDLGWSTHLVQDLTVPHHAALTPLDFHSEYEQWVYDHQSDHGVASGGIYNFSTHLPGHYASESNPNDWVDYNAHFSIDYFPYVDGQDGQGDNDYNYALSILLPRAQRTSAGFVYMFLFTVNSPPIANAGADKSGKQTEIIYFDGSSSSDDMAVVNYTWEFGDGTVGYGHDLTHVYSLPGTYDCNLTVRDSFGLEATDRIKVNVQDGIPPVADAGEDANIKEGETVLLNASGSSDNVGISEFKWVLDAGVIGYDPLLEYTFDTYGVYTVTLQVADEAGNEASDSLSVVVEDITPPTADAGSDQILKVGEVWRFDASNSTDNNKIVSYFWNFGDGNTSTERTHNHSYESSGIYIVTLLVQDVSGNTNTDRIVIQVLEEESPRESGDLLPIAVLIVLVVSIIVILVMLILRPHNGAKED